MSGPLPSENRRRRNAPTIPTTKLPVGGRTEPTLRVPTWVKLGKSGRAWWKWAWSTPQACAWAPGHESMVGRRAALEDDLAAIGTVHSLDAFDLLEALEPDAAQTVRDLIGRLAGLASGRLAIYREMRELDDRLGLTPKGMAALRWTIVADPTTPATGPAEGVTDITQRRRKLDAS
jgi:hypothetical protein